MNIYKRRWINALKIAARVNRLIKSDYVVFDEDGSKMSKFYLEGDELKMDFSEMCTLLFFRNNKDWDHGLYTKIADYNKQFENWEIAKIFKIMELAK
jgi:hypothetical protein